MCHGEFESLKAIDNVSPGFVPKPYAWGQIASEEGSYFLLVEFRHIGCQPAEPLKLASRLADMHLRSVSPTGKFGFHIATCHAKIIQAIDVWDDSWCVVFGRHRGHIIDLASSVVPRLLLPLQSDGRVLKPSLVHGDCWDGNTAMDMKSGEAFIFDVCSFYGHNEYDTGNWRAPRHRLNMTTLCKLFCPDTLRQEMELLRERKASRGGSVVAENAMIAKNTSSEEEEEQEEEEEEEEK
ncbi:Fructosamine kinase-domain-containing protein [Apiosordaria backusii]|uniref:protein-ribulosamine 3-kinase n=1 Tax=Apiosordaria backusii TaxID=314023 RepID=A0AA40DRH1_9PEZI|nr:Fructosamine kinase-domain-containing protein [Apiosordaria backusii]